MRSFLIKNLPLFLIILIAAFLRFYQLGQNPPSLTWDEASNGYNAYSVLKTGRDEYGNFLPLTIRSFGDYNPPLSVYLLIPSIAAFGLNEWAVRFPSALFGTLTVLLTYFLAKKLFEAKIANSDSLLITHDSLLKNVALLATFFLAISPWHLQFSRYDHEANFMVFFTTLGLVCFLYSFKNYRLLIASLVSFGLALNTYQGAKIWIPIFLVAIIFWYRIEIFKFRKKLFIPLIILSLSTLPMILNLEKTLIRGQSVGIFGKSDFLPTFIAGYLSHFSPNFLFTSGDTIGRHSVSGMGELYVFELPLIILAILAILRKRGLRFILLWLLLAPIPAALTTPTPHALRSLTFLPAWSLLAAYGVQRLAHWQSRFKILILSLLILTAVYNIITYFHLYYKHYPKLNAIDWQDGYKEVVLYVDKIKDDYGSIAISNFYGRPYIYVLFYSKYDPVKYHNQSENKNAFDKFEFFSSSWAKTKPGKALVVTPQWQAHPEKIIKQIYAKGDQLVFNISETEK